MDPSIVMLIAFVSILVLVAGLALVLRSLFFGWRQKVEPRIAFADARLRLTDEKKNRSFIGKLDIAFDRLVAQTGLNLSTLAAFLWILLAGTVAGAVVFIGTEFVPAALAAAGVGMLLPLLYFRYCRAKRFKLLKKQLPRALSLLSRAVRAGESVDGAIHTVGRTGAKPLATEFLLCSQQLEMGLSMSSAMRSLAYRLPFLEVRILATALTLERKAGGNIAVVLDQVAAVIRDRQNYRQQFSAMTSGGRLSVLLAMLCIPGYLIFILTYQSEWGMAFFREPQGQLMFVIACLLIASGLFWASRILNTKY